MPVVSTTVGCEGIGVTDGENVLIADDPTEFAAAAVAVARDNDLFVRLGRDGYRLAAERYSPEAVRRRRNQIYDEIVRSHRGAAKV